MTQEDKDLLLRDICSRLLYEVKVTWDGKHPLTVTPYIYCAIASEDNINNLPKLLLRPMSCMTEKEVKEFYDVECMDAKVGYIKPTWDWHFTINGIDWLNAHHFDYRGLIGKGLAIAVTEKNNPYKG